MDVLARDVPLGRFFATADNPPGNVFVMCARPYLGGPGLCQNISDESYWSIEGNRHVRLIREDEQDGMVFHF